MRDDTQIQALRLLQQRYDHVFIPKQSLHRLQNVSKREDDIVRYEDVYGRVIEPTQRP